MTTDSEKKHKWWHFPFVTSTTVWGYVRLYGYGLRTFYYCKHCGKNWELGDE